MPTKLLPVTAMPSTGGIDTLAVLSLREKRLTEHALRQEFSQVPGFVMLQYNPRLDGCFIKFTTAEHATRALQAANVLQLGAELAKRNLGVQTSIGYNGKVPMGRGGFS
eukprot:gnl/MRDRNA2_/MRDRNA2_297169_c0_seq1.p1 gnl/MRDRNA2_/MRDRNA2_297169_c0~~gnl/MRDRNA2_/MRDRNA2_297169_c0_seq1.p1  ORF type:complete len:128 (+),score=22.42 gnl/MRDRNA2_/MRDRNA2_297169_c0_seq1:60-386(+)